jgi:predicted Zn-dependent protease
VPVDLGLLQPVLVDLGGVLQPVLVDLGCTLAMHSVPVDLGVYFSQVSRSGVYFSQC